MNIFSLNLEQLNLEEARKALSDHAFNRLPGVPPFLSKEECAGILGVSLKVIEQIIKSGELPQIDIPSDVQQTQDLFSQLIETQRETCILRADLINFIEKSLLCNKPVLDIE